MALLIFFRTGFRPSFSVRKAYFIFFWLDRFWSLGLGLKLFLLISYLQANNCMYLLYFARTWKIFSINGVYISHCWNFWSNMARRSSFRMSRTPPWLQARFAFSEATMTGFGVAGALIIPWRCVTPQFCLACAILRSGRVSSPVGCPDFKPGEVC